MKIQCLDCHRAPCSKVREENDIHILSLEFGDIGRFRDTTPPEAQISRKSMSSTRKLERFPLLFIQSMRGVGVA